MNETLSTFSAQQHNSTEPLLFKYYQDLPEGSIVEVGTKTGDLEEYKNNDCYEFEVDCFGEIKKLYLENKKYLGVSQEDGLRMFEFLLRGIEDISREEYR
ncbi:MAG: hypothetical protein K0S09_2012 [Sphingobacteriaceae bacterium]|jgi:hypothetical protein|nr:hypothetical protein [Sphingobacteriaceae bacterium]